MPLSLQQEQEQDLRELKKWCNAYAMVLLLNMFFLFIYLVFRSTHTWLLCLLGWLYVSSSLIIYVLFYAC
jgi:hypothetical protein